jgi:hypothetical protein
MVSMALTASMVRLASPVRLAQPVRSARPALSVQQVLLAPMVLTVPMAPLVRLVLPVLPAPTVLTAPMVRPDRRVRLVRRAPPVREPIARPVIWLLDQTGRRPEGRLFAWVASFDRVPFIAASAGIGNSGPRIRQEVDMLRLLGSAIAIATLVGAPLALGDEQKVSVKKNGQIEFTLPSGNIGCIYTPEGGTDTYEPVGGGPELSCDRIEPSYLNVLLGPDGEAESWEDPGEMACCGAENILEYDNEITLDGFICTSEITGLSCMSESGEHGFLMSKAHIVTY